MPSAPQPPPPVPDDFSAFEALLRESHPAQALEFLAGRFRENRQFAELFEVLKMQARHRLGLPVVPLDDAPADDPARQAELEQALYRACGEVGELLFRDGKPALAWRYFQLVGDRPRASQLLREIPLTDHNAGEIISVAIDSGVDPVYGLELVLKHQGLCNAITAFDNQIAYEPRPVRRGAAERLVAALHAELTCQLRRAIETAQSARLPPGLSIPQFTCDRPWLFSDGRTYIDVSHLAAGVRIARLAGSAETLGLAVELCDYGSQIAPACEVRGEFPFDDHFPDHQLFLNGLLGPRKEEAIAEFHRRGTAPGLDPVPRKMAFEVLVALHLAHSEYALALEHSLAGLAGDEGPLGMVPTALQIAATAGRLNELGDYYRNRGNPLMHAICRVLEVAEAPRR
jgi:hypothetical protein